jgi:hypothetical protein
MTLEQWLSVRVEPQELIRAKKIKFWTLIVTSLIFIIFYPDNWELRILHKAT